jgi:uncharacterized protein YcgL (UPF0745 family)
MIVLCTIYKGSREPELYLYADRLEGLGRVPEDLLARLGVLSEVMTIKLTPKRKLARASAPQVLAAIADKGYYLQLPPNIHAPHVTYGGG